MSRKSRRNAARRPLAPVVRLNEGSLALAPDMDDGVTDETEDDKPTKERVVIEPRIGYAGQEYTQGHFDLEHHPDLARWETKIQRYQEIRTGDGSIVAALEKLWWPIARATFDVESVDGPEAEGESADAVQLVRANLLRSESADGLDVYRMKTSWRQFMWECFTAEHFGVSVHEITTRLQPGPLGYKRVAHHLAWINPATILRFLIDRDGFLMGAVQRFPARFYEEASVTAPETSDNKDRFIPLDKLFLHVRKQEGSNVEGLSLLRGMYADAKRNQNLRNWQSVHAQRVAVGIPKVSLSKEAPPEIQARAIEQAKAMRGGAQDRLYVVEAPGAAVGWVDNGTNALDLSGMLRAGEDRTRGVASLEWAGLGLSGTGGSRAVGDVQQRPFWLMVEGIAESIVEDVHLGLVEPIHRLNYAESSPPRLRVADVSPKNVTEIAHAVEKGLVIFTAEDSNDIRRTLGLRSLRQDEMEAQAAIFEKKAEPAPPPVFGAKPGDDEEADPDADPEDDPDRDEGQDEPEPDDGPKDEKRDDKADLAERVPRTGHREKPDERARRKAERARRLARAKLHVPIDAIRQRRDDFLREFVHAIEPLRRAAIEEALSRMSVSGTKVEIPRLRSKPLAEAMRALMERIREFGRESARQEIRSRVAALKSASLAERPPTFDPFAMEPKAKGIAGSVAVANAITEELETVISLNVDDLLEAVARGVRREMLKGLASEMSDADAAEATRRTLFDRSEAPIEQMASHIGARSIAGGRAEAAEQAREAFGDDGGGVVLDYATRLHFGDDDPCMHCADLEGERVEVGSPRYFEIMPPAKCDGGDYCHCGYEYETEAGAQRGEKIDADKSAAQQAKDDARESMWEERGYTHEERRQAGYGEMYEPSGHLTAQQLIDLHRRVAAKAKDPAFALDSIRVLEEYVAKGEGRK